MGNPLVSVVMATFNEPVEYIKASITSILGQTYSNLELIIADDSTNKETFSDERQSCYYYSGRKENGICLCIE